MVGTANQITSLSNSELLHDLLTTKLSETLVLHLICNELIKRVEEEQMWKGEMTEVQFSLILRLLIRLDLYTEDLEKKLWIVADI